ncbi:unnamed protein product [Ectocarpus sp. 6 AP-2014]
MNHDTPQSATALFALIGALSPQPMHAFAARMGSSALLPTLVRTAPSSLTRKPTRMPCAAGISALASSTSSLTMRRAAFWTTPRAAAASRGPAMSTSAAARLSPKTRWVSAGGGLRVRGGAAARAAAGTGMVVATSLSASTASMAEAPTAPAPKYRKDYKAPGHWTRHVTLDINLGDGATVVTSELDMERNADSPGSDLFLDGEELKLFRVYIRDNNGEVTQLQEEDDYSLNDDGMLIKNSSLPSGNKYTVGTVVQIAPKENTRLSGLYTSGGNFCTQCEAEGFRRITFAQDRPDVMSTFSVRLNAWPSGDFPVMLSNGNNPVPPTLIPSPPGGEKVDKSYAIWEDPIPKPSYLFALVAGDLGSIKSTFVTKSGRKVKLEIFSEKENVDQLDWAMESLKAAMKWDEEKFGLEYDLDIFNVVAVNDFNMGAMENKGLNVFNTAYVLAKPETATDLDYERIEGVIGHEYFHNWTGNRVTCRDWFQLTLKEGLTVFRDQLFSGDMGSHAAKRIEDVRTLRSRQFPEDAGPLSHPIRPESYIAMDNFYTATVYVKGAEVIRMYRTLVGEAGFRKGMDLYFKRHDGQAVSCDDFRAAMADANDVSLDQFERWYLQPGTPEVSAAGEYDAEAKTYKLTLKQSSKKEDTLPFHIPVVTGLLLKEDGSEAVASRVLELKEEEQTFTFEDVASEPIPSLLRDLSAPVKLRYEYSDEDLAFLMKHDTDSFNRWEAGQQLSTRVILGMVEEIKAGGEPGALPASLIDSFRATLLEKDIPDKSLQAYALRLPDPATLAEEMDVIDPDALYKALKHVRRSLADALASELRSVYDSAAPSGPYKKNSAEVGRRRLRNTILSYLHEPRDAAAAKLCFDQFEAADCMTDKLAAVACLANFDDAGGAFPERAEALSKFYNDADGDALVLNKWFGIQAAADLPDLLSRVKDLMQHEDFTLKNPNRLRSVVSSFAGSQHKFHAKDGSGYEFLGDMVLEVDQLNPQASATSGSRLVASRLATMFSSYRRFDEKRQGLMREQLARIRDSSPSKDTYEVATRCLG